MRFIRSPIFTLFLCAFLHVPETVADSGRLPRLEDFLRLEEFGLVRPSPDGRYLAVEIRRPRRGESRTESMELFARSDIWIVAPESRDVVRITDGSADGSWYWSPVWSPDGRRLALLAGDVDGHIRLALWERGANGLRLLDRRSVDLAANFGAVAPFPPDGRHAMVWLDSDRILTVLLPEGAYNRDISLTHIRHFRGDQWTRTERGETAATVWDSRAVPVCHPDSTLVLLDVRKGRSRPLMSGALRGVSVSPDGRYAAVIRATASQRTGPEEPAEFPLAWNAYTLDARVSTDLAIVDLEQESPAVAFTDTDGLNFLSRRRFPRWSGDSRHLAIPVLSANGKNRILLLSLHSPKVVRLDARSALDAEILAEILAASPGSETIPGTLDQRRRFGEDSASGSIEAAPGDVGGEVVRLAGSRLAVLSDGQLAVLAGDRTTQYTIAAPEGALVHPLSGNRHPVSSLLFDSGDALSRVEFGGISPRIRTIPKPHPAARMVAALGEQGPWVLIADRDGGSDLWIMTSDGEAGQPVLTRNSHLRDLHPLETRILDYRLPDGAARKGVLLLPPGFRHDRRYPAAIYVYPGVVITDERLSLPLLNSFHVYPRTLLAASGYVVLFPSIPVPRGSDALDILSLVTANVLPAVDALVEQGFADTSRIGVYGHSYGGYATLGLVTQSDRFRAAVASASFADLFSHHDAVWPEAEMLACGPSIARFAAAETETRDGILRMRAPPLAAIDRYVRNSPYFQLRDARTPLLLLHGELDPIPAEAAERTFVALDRRGLPVRFVRYWGEGHNLRSPGNLTHSWSETLSWFDTFVRDAELDP